MPRTSQIPLVTLALLWCAGLGAAGQFAKLSVPFGALAMIYPDAGPWLGLIVSGISLLGIFCGFFAGLLVARMGYRRLLLWALWGGALLSVLQSLLPPVWLMVVLRGVEGISHLIIVVAAPTLMAQLSPERARPAVMTVWSTFFAMTFALVAILAPPVLAVGGVPTLLQMHGASMAIVALVLSRRLRALPTTARATEPLSARGILVAHRDAYASPFTSAPALGWLCYTLTFVSLLTVLPSQLAEADRVWASALMPLAGLAVSLSIGMIAMRYVRAVKITMTGFALGGVAALVLMAMPQNAWLAVGLMGCLGLVQSGSFAAVPQLNRTAETQARANGAMAQMGNLGNTLGTPMLLLLLQAAGPSAIYLGLAAAYAAGLGLHIVQARRRVMAI